MKRTVTLLLAASMIFSLAACGSKNNSTAQQTQALENREPAAASAEPTSTDADPAQPETADTEQKILIAFFSPANSDTVDSVSSATPRAQSVSSVEYLVQRIGEQVDADVARIIPVDAYPLPYQEAADLALAQQNANERPAFILDADPEAYDVLFIGYPVWWYHLPMIMQTFFETYDLSGKTIIPFNTHGGSRDSGTYRDIAALEPGAVVEEGLAVHGERVEKADNSVADWLAKLGY